MSGQIDQVRFQAGEILFRENENSFHFFIIQEGEVEVYKTTGAGEIRLAVVGPGASLGEFAMLDKHPRSASARAMTDLVAARVSAEAYEDLIEDLPDWAVSVMRALVERLRATNDIVRHAQLTEKAATALEAAEFSDTAVRQRSAEATVVQKDDANEAEDDTETDTDFDFSAYTSASEPKGK